MRLLFLILVTVLLGCSDPAEKMIPVTIQGEETYIRVGDKDWTKVKGQWRFNTGTVVNRDVRAPLRSYEDLLAHSKANQSGQPYHTIKRDIILYGYAETPEAIKAVENYINANR